MLSIGDFTQDPGSFQYLVSVLLHIHELSHVMRNRRSINDQSIFNVSRDEGDIVRIMYLDTFLFQFMCKL